MRGAALAVLLLIAAGLAGVAGVQVQGLLDEGGPALAPAPPAPAGPVQPGAAEPPPSPRGQWAEAILARPLFNRDRRPPSGPAAVAAAPQGMPRLAGIVVNGADRSAILVPAEGGKPVVAREGGQVGGLVVQAIQAGRVTLAGPGGTHILRPSYDPRGPAPPPGLAAGAGLALPQPAAFPPFPGLPQPPGAAFAR